MGVTIGGDASKSVNNTHFSDNMRETIADNWSAQLDELESTQKRNSHEWKHKADRKSCFMFPLVTMET